MKFDDDIKIFSNIKSNWKIVELDIFSNLLLNTINIKIIGFDDNSNILSNTILNVIDINTIKFNNDVNVFKYIFFDIKTILNTNINILLIRFLKYFQTKI